jgi:hypothetical protein
LEDKPGGVLSPRHFGGELVSGEFAAFVVDQWQELVTRESVTPGHGIQELCDLRHAVLTMRVGRRGGRPPDGSTPKAATERQVVLAVHVCSMAFGRSPVRCCSLTDWKFAAIGGSGCVWKNWHNKFHRGRYSAQAQ